MSATKLDMKNLASYEDTDVATITALRLHREYSERIIEARLAG